MSLKEELNNIKEKHEEELKQKAEQVKEQKQFKKNKKQEKQISPMAIFIKNYKNGIVPNSWQNLQKSIMEEIKKDVKKATKIKNSFKVDISLNDKDIQSLYNFLSNKRKIKHLFIKWLKNQFKEEGLSKLSIDLYNHISRYYTQKDYEEQEEKQAYYDAQYASEMERFASPSSLYDSPPSEPRTAKLKMTGINNNYGIIVKGKF